MPLRGTYIHTLYIIINYIISMCCIDIFGSRVAPALFSLVGAHIRRPGAAGLSRRGLGVSSPRKSSRTRRAFAVARSSCGGSPHCAFEDSDVCYYGLEASGIGRVAPNTVVQGPVGRRRNRLRSARLYC